MVDEQDIAENLDDDQLPPELPPDEPYGISHYGICAVRHADQARRQLDR
jgi:hypothetical protein